MDKTDFLSLVKILQESARECMIHETNMTEKPVPDPKEDSPLDPRVYEWRTLAAEELEQIAKQKKAEGIEFSPDELLSVEGVRAAKPYPAKDMNEGNITIDTISIDTRNGKTRLSILKPEGGATLKPVLVFFHGGAFIAGTVEATYPFCKVIAEQGDAIVVCVEYRLSPENYYPVGLHDCYDAFDWVCNHAASIGGDASRVAVGGDSAGGTLALGVTIIEQMRAKQIMLETKAIPLMTDADAEHRVAFQALVYPAVLVDSMRLPDYRWRASDYEIRDDDTLTLGAAFSLAALTGQMPLFYIGEPGHVLDPVAAPLLMDDISFMPKTLMAVCEFDYLRLQAEAFSRKMEREGVSHRTILYRGMDHEFINRMGYCPQAYDLAVEIAKELKNI